MSANSPKVGRRARTTKPDMWYYDQLPPSARQALANAAFNWSSGAVLNRWKRGGYKSVQDVARAIHNADKSVKPIYSERGR
jgi:hypothetical protein